MVEMRRAAERIEKDVVREIRERFGLGDSEQPGDQGDVDAAAIVERQRQGVLGRLDLLDHRRLDDAFGEDRTGDAGVTSLIVTLDRGDQPHVGVIKKGLKVRAALIFLFGAGLRIGADAGDRPVDRPVLLDEVPIVVEQRFLQTGVGLIIELGAQDRANGIPDGYQAPDDIGVLLEQAGVAAPGLHADFGGNSVDDLVEDAAQNEIAAFLEVSFVGRCADFHVRGDIQPVAQRCRAIDRAVGAFMSRCDRRQGGRERGFQLDTGFGRAGVFHAELAAAPLMDPEHMIGMVEEVAVDPERPEAFVAVGISASSIQFRTANGASGARLRKSRISTTTSVPASSFMALLGRRTAPRKSAMDSMWRRAFGSLLSSEYRDVTNNAMPPGRSCSSALAMKKSWSDRPRRPSWLLLWMVRFEKGGLPIARSKSAGRVALSKSMQRMT
jgi:hypothetical protein